MRLNLRFTIYELRGKTWDDLASTLQRLLKIWNIQRRKFSATNAGTNAFQLKIGRDDDNE
jgi:hypothetical protein